MKKNKLNYYDEFIKMIEIIERTTVLLKDLIDNYNFDSLEEKNNLIHDLEHEADKIVFDVRNYLISDFLPPIDRVDIGILLHILDNVEDEIDEIAKNFYILNVKSIKEISFQEYIDLLEEAALTTKKIFNGLSNKKKRKALLDVVNDLYYVEDKADRVYEKYMKILYEKERNSLNVIKWTTIFNGFETLFDNYEAVADCIEEIIIKTL